MELVNDCSYGRELPHITSTSAQLLSDRDCSLRAIYALRENRRNRPFLWLKVIGLAKQRGYFITHRSISKILEAQVDLTGNLELCSLSWSVHG